MGRADQRATENYKPMPKEITNKTEEEIHPHTKGIFSVGAYIKCKKCGTEVLSITHGSLTPCKCGAISVDGSKELVRVIGKPEDYEEIQK